MEEGNVDLILKDLQSKIENTLFKSPELDNFIQIENEFKKLTKILPYNNFYSVNLFTDCLDEGGSSGNNSIFLYSSDKISFIHTLLHEYGHFPFQKFDQSPQLSEFIADLFFLVVYESVDFNLEMGSFSDREYSFFKPETIEVYKAMCSKNKS